MATPDVSSSCWQLLYVDVQYKQGIYYARMNPIIYAADIGSIAGGNFGWARLDYEHGSELVEHGGGTEISDLVQAVALDLDERRRGVALGFECPLFVPVPDDANKLGKARHGDGDRSWSAGPGTGALATGLVQTAWILRELRTQCTRAAVYLDWDSFVTAGSGLFLWEAFVTGAAKAATHVDDARIAAATFQKALPMVPEANAVTADRPISLIGAALLWSGWSNDATILHKPALTIKAIAKPEPRGPVVTPASVALSHMTSGSVRERVCIVAEQIPAGSWTTYGDIGAKIGCIARNVANALRSWDIPNAHRILTVKGELSAGFQWPDGRRDDPAELLENEGIRFTDGRADPTQRWYPQLELDI